MEPETPLSPQSRIARKLQLDLLEGSLFAIENIRHTHVTLLTSCPSCTGTADDADLVETVQVTLSH